jgi:hypothetical protein
MEQALRDGGREQDVVWDEARAGAGWEAHSPQARADIVFVLVVDTGRRTWWASPAIKEAAQHAALP